MAIDSYLKKFFVRTVLLAFFFQVIGCIVPGWIIFKEVESERQFSFSIGFWFMVFCEKADNIGHCNMVTMQSVIEAIPKDSWAIVYFEEMFEFADLSRILSIISLTTCVASIFLMCLYYCGSREPSLRVATIQSFLLSFSGVLILVVVGYFARWNIILNKDVVHSKISQYEMLLPWCLIISTIGGILAISAAAVNAVRAIRNRKVVVRKVRHEPDTKEILELPRIAPRVKTVDMWTNTPSLDEHFYDNVQFIKCKETGDVIAQMIDQGVTIGINPSY